MKRLSNWLAVGLVCFLINSIEAHAQEWPQWQGPGRDARTTTFADRQQLPDSLQRIWRTEVGEGHAAPVAANGRTFTLSRIGEKEALTALDLKSGKVLWQQRYDAPFKRNQYALRHGKGPFATPLVHDGLVFSVGVTGILTCANAESGTILWQEVFKTVPLNTEKFFCGNASSPLWHDGAVITFIGDDDRGALTARDARTGKVRWEWRGDNPGYASPVLANPGGLTQIVTLSQSSVIGLDAASGKLLWQVPFPSEWKENIPTPVVMGDHVIYSGVKRGITALKIRNRDGSWTAEQVWHRDDAALYMNTPLLHEGRLYGLSHLKKGQFFCLDAKTGKNIWMGEGRQAQQASLATNGRDLIALTTDGQLLLAPLSTEGFAPSRRWTVASSATWAAPGLLPDAVLVKDKTGLALWKTPAD